MSDIDIESLKTLFENMVDKLDETKGDEQSQAALAALRESIQKLLKEMQNQGSSTVQKRNAHEFIREFFAEWKKIDPMGNVQKAIEESSNGQPGEGTPGKNTILDELRSGGGKLSKARNDLSKEMGIFGQITKKGGGLFGNALSGASGKLGLLGLAVGGATAATKGIMDWGTKQIDSYRTIIGSAEGTVGSIQELNKAALNAGMTVDELAASMKTGSDGARLLGAVRFAQLNDSVRRSTREVGLLGMSNAELREAQSNYLDQLRNLGTINDTNVSKMTAGITSMVKSSDLTANILGKTREEALAANKELLRDKNITASAQAQGISVESLNEIRKIAIAVGGDSADAIVKDLVATGSITNQDAAKAAAVNPQLLDILSRSVDQAKSGQATSDIQKDLASSLKGLGNTLAKDTTRTRTFAALGQITGDEAFTVNSRLVQDARSLNTDTARQNQVLAGSTDKASNALLNTEDVLKRFQTNLELAVSKPMVAFMDTFGDSMMGATNMAYNFSDALKGVTNTLDGHESATAKVTAALLVVGGSLLAFNTIVNTINGAKGLFGVLKGLGGAGGAAGAAGRVAGTAGAARNGTILSQLMGGGRVAAGAEGVAAAGAGRGLAALFGLAGLGVAGAVGVGMGAKGVADHQGESFFGGRQGEKGLLHSRAGGYGTAVASGAAGGAAIGALFGGVGAVPGAAIGAGVGLGSAFIGDNWNNITAALTGKKPNQVQAGGALGDIQPTRSNADQTLRNVDRTGGSAPASINKEPKSPLDSMADRVVAAQSQSNTHLKHLLEATNQQVKLQQEELALYRSFFEKMTKNQEDTVRAVRQQGNLL